MLCVVPKLQCILWNSPELALRHEVVREHFRRASRHYSVRMTMLPQPGDQQESLGAVIQKYWFFLSQVALIIYGREHR